MPTRSERDMLPNLNVEYAGQTAFNTSLNVNGYSLDGELELVDSSENEEGAGLIYEAGHHGRLPIDN